MPRGHAFRSNEDGSVMPIFMLSLTAILALVGASIALNIDTGAANNLQHTADTAAIGGATAFVSSSSPKLEDRIADAKAQASRFAEENAVYKVAAFDLVSASEDEYGQHLKLEVEVAFEPANAAAKMAGRNANVKMSRRAVSEATWGFPLCLFALSTEGEAFSLSDNAAYSSKNCIVWSNSSDMKSLNFKGGSAKAHSLCTAGGSFGATRSTPSPKTQCAAIPDPLSSWAPPTPGKCPAGGSVDPADLVGMANQLDDILKVDFEPTRFMEEHTELLLVLEHMDKGGWNGKGPKGLATIAAQVAEIAAIESELSGFNNLNQYFKGHDYFNLANNTLDNQGRLNAGAGQGRTLAEEAQLLGLFDNSDPADYAGDTYVDTPTVILTPGTYCGLDIAKGHVKFEPGTYHIKDGPLIVRRRATLTGEGVTIIMSGQNAFFGVLDEARLTLSAPISGSLAGFALTEDKSRTYSKAGLSLPNLPQLGLLDRPLSRLTGSGVIDAIGTIYLPGHDLKVTGNGAGKQISPLLQIVANTVSMSENGQISIVYDEEKTKVPAGLKPERYARLVE